MTDNDPSKIDQLLDLLLDALNERRVARSRSEAPASAAPPTTKAPASAQPAAPRAAQPAAAQAVAPPADEAEAAAAITPEAVPIPATAPQPAPSTPYLPEKLPTIRLDRLLGRLTLFLLGFTILINIPYNRFGTNLARAMPDEQALVIRDGLVLKGEGSEIYVLEDNHKRWISSLDAFRYYGYRWEQVNQVTDDYLARFPDGPALSVLYKCSGSPHVYAIENGIRRWIKDIPTFVDQGYVWDDVQLISCTRLRAIPAGPPIPPDAGDPPAH